MKDRSGCVFWVGLAVFAIVAIGSAIASAGAPWVLLFPFIGCIVLLIVIILNWRK